MSSSRRYASRAKRSCATELTPPGGDESIDSRTSSFMPRLRTVSIMPASKPPRRSARRREEGGVLRRSLLLHALAGEASAHGALDVGDALAHLVPDRGERFRNGVRLVRRERGGVQLAHLRGYGKARGDVQAEERHLREARAFAAEDRLHRAIAVRGAAAEAVGVLDERAPRAATARAVAS